MNAKHVTYWISTALLCAFMAFIAYGYLSREPKLVSAFLSLGYPLYFPLILGVAKVLGIIALLVPGPPHLKEWAYAGFTFTFVGAIFSHLESSQSQAALMPLIALFVLAVSYMTRPADRRPVMESEAEHRHFGGGVAVR